MAKFREGSVNWTLMHMEVGSTEEFPIIQTPTIRSSASLMGVMYHRVYTTRTDKEKGLILVTRNDDGQGN